MTMVLDNETTNGYEHVDAFEMLLSSNGRRWAMHLPKLVTELKNLPEGKALRRKFTEATEQASFANAVRHTLKKLGMDKEFVVSMPRGTEDKLFAVYIGRQTSLLVRRTITKPPKTK